VLNDGSIQVWASGRDFPRPLDAADSRAAMTLLRQAFAVSYSVLIVTGCVHSSASETAGRGSETGATGLYSSMEGSAE